MSLYRSFAGGPSQGGIKVSVLNNRRGMPLENAMVRVIDRLSGALIEQLHTDDSGQSSTLWVSAPPPEYSLEPGGGARPYSEYDIEVSAEGFRSVRINGAQVLPGDVSLVEAVLAARADEGEPPEEISIGEHALYGIYPPKEPESDIKRLELANGHVVLDGTVIPEGIVVHDGIPQNTAAKDYYVPFKDYIKNVASCEIYSTWPKQAIMANVLAIISLTLSRVYTGWYKNKGYPFAITSSTALDQAFSFGRSIFKEISVVVDDMFMSYITKPGIEQPLFTQCCDGKRATTPGFLSRWGSVQLGEKGHSALDILGHYYGGGVYLRRAKAAAGTVAPYGGTPLRQGGTGASVRALQSLINSVATNYPAIPNLRVDGIFGRATKSSVETFQRIFDLAVDGVVGTATWHSLVDMHRAVTGRGGQ